MSRQHLKNKLCRIALSACVFFLLSLPAFSAEKTAAEKTAKVKGPIVITSKTLTADNKANTAVFEKDVIARTAELTMYSDRMRVSYEKDTGNVTRIDAEGTVKVVKADRIITSQKATYFAKDEKVVFEGDPRAVQGENVVTGSAMTYLMEEDRFVVENSKVFLINKKEE